MSEPEHRSYSSSEWKSRKSLVEQLYFCERQSIDLVVRRLRSEGFMINERMLKTRIKRWKLGKNLKLTDMRAAIQLMAANDFERSGIEPKFKIRGRVVCYSEILRYFRRKKISDPLKWLDRLPKDDFAASSDVELLYPHPTVYTPDSTDDEEYGCFSKTSATPSQSPRSHIQQRFEMPAVGWAAIPTSTGNEVTNCRYRHALFASQPYSIMNDEKILYFIDNYCTIYLASNRAVDHTEPPVHHLTTHGMLGQHMQDGMSLLLRSEISAAFDAFELAFELLRELLRDHHPMSISLMLAVVCELHSKKANALIFQFLRYINSMAKVEFGEFDPLTKIFKTLAYAGDNVTELSSFSLHMTPLAKVLATFFSLLTFSNMRILRQITLEI